MRQGIIDFIRGFSETMIRELNNDKIEKAILEKIKNKIFVITIPIILTGIGIFVAIWGIAFYVDERFAMKGFGLVLVGIIATLAGLLLNKR